MLQKRRDKKASRPKQTANTTQSSDGRWSHLSLKSSLKKLRYGKSSDNLGGSTDHGNLGSTTNKKDGNLGGSTDHGNLGSTTDKKDGNNGSIELDREEEKREEEEEV